MDRIIAPYSVDQAHAAQPPEIGEPGFAVDGNPALGQRATVWPAYQYNALQEELINLILGAGLVPDRFNNALVLQAVQKLIQLKTGMASDTAAGVVKLATSAQAQAWLSEDAVLTPKRLGEAFKGANQSLAASGYQKSPGGTIEQWFTANNTNNLGTGFTRTAFPIAFPTACRGISITTITSSGGSYQVGFSCFVNAIPASFDWTAYNASLALAPTSGLISIHVRAIGN